jgi:outer membrane usher protein
MARNRPVEPAAPSPPGVYLNYDLSTTAQEGGERSYGGLFEAVVFGNAGSFVSGLLVRSDRDGGDVLRTDTYWRRDLPERMTSLVIGDTISSSGGWSQPVRFAGVRYGRDFSLAPTFISYPMPALNGSAALPSTVDVLVDGLRRGGVNVGSGPFELTNIPVITGAGQLNVVVRDLLGNETVITQGYYTTPRLLAPGLSDFSFEAGAFRQGFGSTDDGYGPMFASATYRRGLNDSLTLEGRTELQTDRQAAGVDVVTLLGQVGVLHAAAAWSTNDDNDAGPAGSGGHYLFGFERTTPLAGASLQWEHFDRGYQPFGDLFALERRPRDRLQATAVLSLNRGSSLGASYIGQTDWAGDSIKLLSANLSAYLPGGIALSAYVSSDLEDGGAWSGGISLVKPLGQRRTVARAPHALPAAVTATASTSPSRLPPVRAWAGERGRAATTARPSCRPGRQSTPCLASSPARAIWPREARRSGSARAGRWAGCTVWPSPPAGSTTTPLRWSGSATCRGWRSIVRTSWRR